MEGLGDLLHKRNRAYNEQSDGVKITEIFQQEDSIELETRKITNADIVPWLDQRFAVDEGANKRDGIMRIVWVEVDGRVHPWRLDINESIYESLLKSLELERARQLIPSDGGIICLPADHQNKQSYALTVPGTMLKVIWIYNLMTNRTEVIWEYGNYPFSPSHVPNILKYQKILVRYPMFMAFLAAMLLLNEFGLSVSRLNKAISRVENRTRHSSFNGSSLPAAEGSYAFLSAIMSGGATEVARIEWDRKINCEILDTLSSYQWPKGIERPQWAQDTVKEIGECVEILKTRVKALEHVLRFHSRRVDIQLTALFHLITREETRLSISVAKDSRTIASATKEDSTAMKALAAVTVVFLPSTFVAALFSMPLFQWNTETVGHSVISKQFWIFWVVSIPLTIVTLILWFAWMRLQTRRRRAREEEDEEAIDELEDFETSSELRDTEAMNREITENPNGKLKKRRKILPD